jgi:hypothetical protein
VPNFIVPVQKQKTANRVAAAQNEVNRMPIQSPPNEPKTKEVFYDARSGNRYILSENGKVKLSDEGAVVISQDTRQTANIARSTFFAAPIKK